MGKESSTEQTEKLSKAALKNKRKREAKQRSKEQEVNVCVCVRERERDSRFLVSALKLCAASKMHAIPIERNTYIRFPPMGVTGTWPKRPERALNIICIS